MTTRIKPDEQFARLLEISSPVAAGADPSMGGMANLANALRAAGQSATMPSPDPVFRAALRQRLVAVATVQSAEPAVTTQRSIATVKYRAQRRIAALAGVVTLATSVAGVGVAAARSLPGDPFYGVKRATESIQLWTARGDEAKGKRHLEFARTRLAEAQALSPNSSHLASTLASMDAQTKAGSAELITAYQSSHSTQPLAELEMFSSQQLSDLNQLAATLPAALKAKEANSATVVTGVVKQVNKVANGVCILCGSNGGVPTPGVSRTPSAHPTTHPTKNHPSTPTHGQSPSAHPTKTAGGPGTSKSPHPTTSHTPLLPKPSTIISSILHPRHTKHPIPIVTKLLGLLGR